MLCGGAPKEALTILPIGHFEVIESDRHITVACLEGQEAWCRERYADHPYLDPNRNDPVSRYVQQNPCIIPTLIHYNFEPYVLESEWMEGFKNIVSAGVGIGLSPVIIGEVLDGYLATFGRERMAEAATGFCIARVHSMPSSGSNVCWAGVRRC